MAALWGARQRDRPPAGPPWLAPVLRRAWIDAHWLMVALALAGAGAVFFGWRALVCLGVTASATVFASLLTRLAVHLLRPAHALDSPLHALNLGLLLGLSLPVTRTLEVPLTAGLLLGTLLHVAGRARRVRLHPVALVLVLVWLMPALAGWDAGVLRRASLEPIQAVLKPGRIVVGDLTHAGSQRPYEPWWAPSPQVEPDALPRLAPGELVLRERQRMLEQENMLVHMLSSAELARLEELLLGCTPGAIGGSSRGLVLLLGVYLMYRRLAWWPTAVAALLAALATLAVMPMAPYEGGIVLTRLLANPLPVSITYVAYMLLAPPLALIVLILAPITAPISAQGRLIYGSVLGATAMAAMWLVPVPAAAFLGLVVASGLSRPLDWLQRSPLARGTG